MEQASCPICAGWRSEDAVAELAGGWVASDAAGARAAGAFAAAFTVSDSLADLVWDPQFHHPDTVRGLDRLYVAAAAAIAS